MRDSKRPYHPSPHHQLRNDTYNQSTINSYFTPSTTLSDDLYKPQHVSTQPSQISVSMPQTALHQTSLLSLGMRIRKSVLDGYKRSSFPSSGPLSPTTSQGKAPLHKTSPPASWNPMTGDDSQILFSSQSSTSTTASSSDFFSTRKSAPKRSRSHDLDDDDASDADDEKENATSSFSFFSALLPQQTSEPAAKAMTIAQRPKLKAVTRRKKWRDAPGEAEAMEWAYDHEQGGDFGEAGFLMPL